MRIKVSKEDLEGLPVLEPGFYPGTVVSVEKNKKAGAGEDDPGYLRIMYEIDGEDTPDGKRRRVSQIKSLKPQALWSLGNLAKALGVDLEEDEEDETSFDIDTDDLIGLEGNLKVVIDEYQGNQINNVDEVHPLT